MIGCYRFSKKVAPHNYGIKVIQILMGGIITRCPRPSRIKPLDYGCPQSLPSPSGWSTYPKKNSNLCSQETLRYMRYNKKKYGQNSGRINRQITGEVHIRNTPLDVDSIAAVPTCMHVAFVQLLDEIRQKTPSTIAA